LLLIGAGLSVVGQAIGIKSNKKGFFGWFFLGTIGLMLFNAGVSLFGEAIKHRTLYELEVKRLREE